MSSIWKVYLDKDLWNLTADFDDPVWINNLTVTRFSPSSFTAAVGDDELVITGAFTYTGSPTTYGDISGFGTKSEIYRNGALRSLEQSEQPGLISEFILTENDYLIQYGGDDSFTGSPDQNLDDAVQGLSGNDTFTGFGDVSYGDKFFGGTGNDEARFRGNQSEYEIAYNDSIYDNRTSSNVSGFTVTDTIANRDGTDHLTDVEYLRFADSFVAVNVDSINGAVSISVSGYSETGTADADAISGYSGNDSLLGGAGADTMSGGLGDDLIYGNLGADRLVGGAGLDTLFGGQQSDAVFGSTGADQVYGNKQNDTLYGGIENDSLFGGQHDDLLYGQEGDDRVDGNRGNDTLFGGNGSDTFVISKGGDWVMDFSITEDKIETADAYSAIAQAISGGNLMLTDSDGDTLTLLGVSSTLTEEYFL